MLFSRAWIHLYCIIWLRFRSALYVWGRLLIKGSNPMAWFQGLLLCQDHLPSKDCPSHDPNHHCEQGITHRFHMLKWIVIASTWKHVYCVMSCSALLNNVCIFKRWATEARMWKSNQHVASYQRINIQLSWVGQSTCGIRVAKTACRPAPPWRPSNYLGEALTQHLCF